MRRRSVRWRLALSYASVFFAFGAVLLGISYVVVRHEFGPRKQAFFTQPVTPSEATTLPLPDEVRAAAEARPQDTLRMKILVDRVVERNAAGVRNVLVAFAGALLLSTIASLGVGWWLAGRALAPVSRITEAARRVSDENLHERIALEGPDDELKELADTFDAMLSKLDHAFDGQRRFVAHASHELRTPLAVMRAALDVNAEDGGLDDPQAIAEMVTTLRRNVARSEELVDRLLALATGAAETDRRDDVAIGALVADALDGVAARATDGDLAITTHGLDDGVMVSGDPVLLRHLMRNLVENAVIHNRPGGALEIACRRDGDRAELRIRNDGPRLEGEVANLLQPFHRAAGTGRAGHGLGLSIADAVVRAHDGELALRARDEGGLEVEVRLPARFPVPATV